MKKLMLTILVTSISACTVNDTVSDMPNPTPTVQATYTICETDNCGDNVNIIVE